MNSAEGGYNQPVPQLDLPFTGFDALPVVLMGVFLILAGLSIYLALPKGSR